jgi:2-oxo-4-hydroxy-4-carboxy-5-ureidoimidazoline decarboxylase
MAAARQLALLRPPPAAARTLTAVSSNRRTIEQVNVLGCAAFVDTLGWVFEGSPWIARAAWERRPFRSLADLHRRLCEAVAEAPLEAQLALVNAHPALGVSALRDAALSRVSQAEQRSAGLDTPSDVQLDRLLAAADAFQRRFGFQCIVCVRNHPRPAMVADQIERRLRGTVGAQLDASIREVFEIARLRLSDAIVEDPLALPATATGSLTTHVLDTARGTPGEGMRIELWRSVEQQWTHLQTVVTNADGRTDAALLAGGQLTAGRYQLRFGVGPYFASAGVAAAGPPYLDMVPVEVGVADPQAHYHVPLIVAPWGYSTYRGS